MQNSLVYIIIRPIAVVRGLNHDHPNGKCQGCVLRQELGGCVRQMTGLLKKARHQRFDKVKGWDTEGDARCIDQKEHAQLMEKVA